jgi:hypothetical protein
MKVTKWSTLHGDFDVSEQQAEQTHDEGGSVGTEPAVHTSSFDASPADASAPVMASATEASTVDAPAIAPDHETLPKDDTPKETSKIDPIKMDAAEPGVAKLDAPKVDALGGRLLILSPGKRSWRGDSADAKAESEPAAAASNQRRFAGMAAVVGLAVLAGAVSGALATVGVMRFAAETAAATSDTQAVEASVSRIDADIAALKAGLEHVTKNSTSQFNKANDRLEKIEKAQAEPASKLAKLSEAMDRLRIPPAAAAPMAAATPASAKEVTGSVPPASSNAMAAASATTAPPAPATPPKTEAARLPTVEGWVLRDINHGGALIEGRQGLYEVYAGDPVPGLGKVDAIRKQDGRWVVVTTKGLVVAR